MSNFGISKHEFSDDDICINEGLTDLHGVWIEDSSNAHLLCFLEKQDAIAIAKHFRLTAEDLG